MKWQTRTEVCDDNLLNLFDSLPLPACYKIKYLEAPVTYPHWAQTRGYVSLNIIDVTPRSFVVSSNVLPWNLEDDDPPFDNINDMDTVQVLRIITLKFISDQLTDYTHLSTLSCCYWIQIHSYFHQPHHCQSQSSYRWWWRLSLWTIRWRCWCYRHKPTFLSIFVTTKLMTVNSNVQVKFTGAIGSNDVNPLGEGYLYVPDPVPWDYLPIRCFYSSYSSSTLVSPWDILKTTKN